MTTEHSRPTAPAVPADATEDLLGRVELQSAVLIRHFEMLRRRTDIYRDLERAEYLLLRTLDAHGAAEICGLAARLGLDPSTAGRQVHALAERGLVERSPDPADRRRSIITLTRQGLTLMRKVQSQRQEESAALLRTWSAEEIRELADALTRYNEAVADRYLN